MIASMNLDQRRLLHEDHGARRPPERQDAVGRHQDPFLPSQMEPLPQRSHFAPKLLLLLRQSPSETSARHEGRHHEHSSCEGHQQSQRDTLPAGAEWRSSARTDAGAFRVWNSSRSGGAYGLHNCEEERRVGYLPSPMIVDEFCCSHAWNEFSKKKLACLCFTASL